MSTALLIAENSLPPTPADTLCRINAVENYILSLPQIEIRTEHILHGGLYARTIRLAPGVVITGALVKVPTILIVHGKCSVFVGNGWVKMDGYNVIAASKGRKQIFVTSEETSITVVFRTDAKTIEEAEEEFTDDAEKLMSRLQENGDIFTVTGE